MPGPTLAERLEWFRDLKFGLFMHWGPYSQWGCIESWPLVEEDTWARPDDLPAWAERGRDIERFRRDYFALNGTFNPSEFDPATWAKAAKRAGMQYVVFTTKHHDGFCMFDTRQTDYRITHPDCPFSRDPRANIALRVFDAFRARGFGIGAYFSKSDWHCPHYWSPDHPARTRNPNYDTHAEPEKWEQFVQFVHGQIEELVTGYGPVDILWLDGGQVRPPSQDIRMDEIARMARGHQPGLIIADRTVGGEHENYLTPEQEVPDQPLLGKPWESCITMGDQWSFKPNGNYKPARDLIQLLIGVVAKGGNLLLNIGPQPDGRLPEVALSRLEEIGDWMQVNAEAIHGTRPWDPFEDGQLRFTFSRRGGACYAFCLAADGETHPPAEITLPVIADPRHPIHMLGVEQELERRYNGETVVRIPDEVMANPPCRHAWTLRLREAN
jgi:alpha-L-fucosidase